MGSPEWDAALDDGPSASSATAPAESALPDAASGLTHRRSRAAVEASTSAPARPRGKSRLPPKQALTSWPDLPPWLKDNEYIVHHYRVGGSWRDTVRSLFGIHNETGNIWTHLVGFFVFVALTLAVSYLRPAPFQAGKELLLRLETQMVDLGSKGIHDLYELEQQLVRAGAAGLHEFRAAASQALSLQRALQALGVESFSELEDKLLKAGKDSLDGLSGGLSEGLSTAAAEFKALEERLAAYAASNWRSLRGLEGMRLPVARWPMYVFTGGAMACLLISTLCHLFGCCSQHVALWIWRLDYAGISVLIVASFYPPVYYAFLCQERLRSFYLASTTLMGVATLCASLMEVFQTPRYRPIRAGMYAGLGMWGIVPMLHGALLYAAVPQVRTALLLDLLMGVTYLAGAAVYALRVPERWKPGAFDLAFHSHQLFHVAVVVAAAIHYKSALLFLDWRDTHACDAPTMLA